MSNIIHHEKWQKKSERWKNIDDMQLLVEAMEILLRCYVPEGDVISTDTESQRAARLMHIELKRRIEKGKSQEQIYKEALIRIMQNAEKMMPAHKDAQELLVFMNATKNHVLKKMYAILQYCRTTLGITPPNSPPQDTA